MQSNATIVSRHSLSPSVDPGASIPDAHHRHQRQDPLIVARLLVVGRDCLLQTQYKVSGGSELRTGASMV